MHFPLALLIRAPHAFIFTRLHAIDVGTLLPFLHLATNMGFIEAPVALPLALRIGGAFAIALTAGVLFWATIERLGSRTRVKRLES